MIFECQQLGSDGTQAKASYGYEETRMECCKDITVIKTGLTTNPKPGCENKRAF